MQILEQNSLKVFEIDYTFFKVTFHGNRNKFLHEAQMFLSHFLVDKQKPCLLGRALFIFLYIIHTHTQNAKNRKTHREQALLLCFLLDKTNFLIF